jgi:hypothetical protein
LLEPGRGGLLEWSGPCRRQADIHRLWWGGAETVALRRASLEPAIDVLQRLQKDGPVDAGTDRKVHGLVIGSNGGGLAYVAGPDGVIYRTRTASLDEPELDKVADDLRQFLELLEHSLTRFIADGETGTL